MSPTAFHQHFKSGTSVSPLQYQKRFVAAASADLAHFPVQQRHVCCVRCLVRKRDPVQPRIRPSVRHVAGARLVKAVRATTGMIL